MAHGEDDEAAAGIWVGQSWQNIGRKKVQPKLVKYWKKNSVKSTMARSEDGSQSWQNTGRKKIRQINKGMQQRWSCFLHERRLLGLLKCNK